MPKITKQDLDRLRGIETDQVWGTGRPEGVEPFQEHLDEFLDYPGLPSRSIQVAYEDDGADAVVSVLVGNGYLDGLPDIAEEVRECMLYLLGQQNDFKTAIACLEPPERHEVMLAACQTIVRELTSGD